MFRAIVCIVLSATFLVLDACTKTPAVNAGVKHQAKVLYKKVIQLRFEQPGQALIAVDSVLLLTEHPRMDTFLIYALVQKSLLRSEARAMPEAIQLAEKALDNWQPADGIFAKCKAYEQMGQCLLVQKNYEAARGYFQKELELAPMCGEKALGIESIAASYLGELYEKQGKLSESVRMHEQALASAKIFGGTELVAGAYHSMASAFQKMGDPEKQFDCLRKAAASFDSTDYRRAASYLNLANTFLNQKQNDSANYYIQKVYLMPNMPPQIQLVSMVGYGGVLTEKKAFAAARKLMEEAIQLADTIGDGEHKAIALNQIGATYTAEGDFQTALKYSLKADAVLRDTQTTSEFSAKFDVAKSIVRAQLLADGHPDIAQQLNCMQDYRDSVGKIEYLEVLANYRNQIQADSIALLSTQNQLQSASLQTKNRMLALAILGSLLLAVLAFIWRRNLQLSTENIGILGEQNQKLKDDNFKLQKDLDHIRGQADGDKSLMLEQSISLPTRNNLMLKLGEIMYIQAFGGGVYYVTPEKKHLVWHSFDGCMKTLPGEFFVKTHRSFIVNKTFVEQFSPSKIFLKNGETLPIGVTLKDAVRERLGF